MGRRKRVVIDFGNPVFPNNIILLYEITIICLVISDITQRALEQPLCHRKWNAAISPTRP